MCKLQNPNLQKKVARKFLEGMRDNKMSYNGALYTW